MFTIVYGRPKHQQRGPLWKELEAMETSSPWCAIRDFNSVLRSDERSPVERTSGYFEDCV